MSSASQESFSTSQIHPADHDISFSVAPFMPPKSVIYRYFQILKDPQYYSPILITSANAGMAHAHVSPQTHAKIDDRIFS